VRTQVAGYLKDGEIEALLARRNLILEEIDRFIRKEGETNVLY
jgi:hypothetical protein